MVKRLYQYVDFYVWNFTEEVAIESLTVYTGTLWVHAHVHMHTHTHTHAHTPTPTHTLYLPF